MKEEYVDGYLVGIVILLVLALVLCLVMAVALGIVEEGMGIDVPQDFPVKAFLIILPVGMFLFNFAPGISLRSLAVPSFFYLWAVGGIIYGYAYYNSTKIT